MFKNNDHTEKQRFSIKKYSFGVTSALLGIFLVAGANSAQAEEVAPATQAPATQAPVTQAPATQAPATQAPATQAPATQAPATQAPATQASATQVPATQAPATQAPATQVSVEENRKIIESTVIDKHAVKYISDNTREYGSEDVIVTPGQDGEKLVRTSYREQSLPNSKILLPAEQLKKLDVVEKTEYIVTGKETLDEYLNVIEKLSEKWKFIDNGMKTNEEVLKYSEKVSLDDIAKVFHNSTYVSKETYENAKNDEEIILKIMDKITSDKDLYTQLINRIDTKGDKASRLFIGVMDLENEELHPVPDVSIAIGNRIRLYDRTFEENNIYKIDKNTNVSELYSNSMKLLEKLNSISPEVRRIIPYIVRVPEGSHTDVRTNKIALNNEAQAEIDSSELFVFFHELGHVIESYSGVVLLSEASMWAQIWEEVFKDNLNVDEYLRVKTKGDDGNESDPKSEAFADSFALYMTDITSGEEEFLATLNKYNRMTPKEYSAVYPFFEELYTKLFTQSRDIRLIEDKIIEERELAKRKDGVVSKGTKSREVRSNKVESNLQISELKNIDYLLNENTGEITPKETILLQRAKVSENLTISELPKLDESLFVDSRVPADSLKQTNSVVKPKFDLTSILNGDLSSIYGDYKINTDVITFDNNKTVGWSRIDLPMSIVGIEKDGDRVVIKAQSPYTDTGKLGPGIVVRFTVTPAGVKAPEPFKGGDINKDRIYAIGHGATHVLLVPVEVQGPKQPGVPPVTGGKFSPNQPNKITSKSGTKAKSKTVSEEGVLPKTSTTETNTALPAGLAATLLAAGLMTVKRRKN